MQHFDDFLDVADVEAWQLQLDVTEVTDTVGQ